jgi:hypothetical protein
MRPRLPVAVATVTSLLGMGLAVPASAAAAAAPSGMHRFVVSIGKVDAGSRANWNRLGTYTLTDAGEVTESHWHWTQRERVARSYTGVPSANCGARSCNVQTGNGFQSTSAHGWVGIEASINQTVPAQGTNGDDIGVFVIADA